MATTSGTSLSVQDIVGPDDLWNLHGFDQGWMEETPASDLEYFSLLFSSTEPTILDSATSGPCVPAIQAF
jgi:hypothetical protein